MSDKDPKTGRFLAGNGGGGRPKGSRNKLGEQFLEELARDFAEHGPEAIAAAREQKPTEYLKVIAGLLPKELLVRMDPVDEISEEEIADVLEVIRELSPKAVAALYDRLTRELDKRQRQKVFYRMFPDEDIVEPDGTVFFHARHKYQKHLEFFWAGAKYRERCAMCANRVGKTFGMGGYETTCHLTGEYPKWWPGRRFEKPVRWWAAGKTNETTRDVMQATLLGDIAERDGRKHFDGTGVIPGHALGAVTWKQGISDFVDTIKVRHVSGGWSRLGFKSYQQGRGSFEGTAQHGIWLDEEPPEDVYGECLMRTATTNGIIMLTFTPLNGLSPVVLSFMPKEMRPWDGA